MRQIILLLLPLMFLNCQNSINEDVSENKIKVACVGNSITYGLYIENRDMKSYPSQLNKMLGNEYWVGNYGISGRTMLKLGDLPYWEETEFEEATAILPDIVIIKLGTNDAKSQNWKHASQFVNDYLEMISVFSGLTSKPKIYLCYPVPIFQDRPDLKNEVIINGIIPKIDSIANLADLPIIDLYNPLLNSGEHFPDGLHPNAAGAEIIARTIEMHISATTGFNF